MTDDKPRVTIYTDGGSEPNPGPGGWGALLLADSGETKELSGAAPDTTNNRMELTAAIEALNALKQPCDITLYTDSQYLRRGISEWLPGWIRRGWKRKGDKPIQNVDLWRDLHAATQRHAIDWQWVKGHAGNAHNEHVDQLATHARRELTGATGIKPAPTAPGADSGSDAAPQIVVALRVSVPRAGGRGGYAFRLLDQDAGTQDTFTGHISGTTSNQIVLVAARDALEHTPEGAVVRVYCPDTYLQQGMTQWVAGWQRRGWKSSSGSAVKNQAEWRELVQAASTRSVQWATKKAEPDTIATELDALASAAARGQR